MHDNDTPVPSRPYHEHMLDRIKDATKMLRSYDELDDQGYRQEPINEQNQLRELIMIETLTGVIIGTDLPDPDNTPDWPSVETPDGQILTVPEAFNEALNDLFSACHHPKTRQLVKEASIWIRRDRHR